MHRFFGNCHGSSRRVLLAFCLNLAFLSMKFRELIKQSRLFTVVWNMSIFTLGMLLTSLLYHQLFSLPMIISYPIIGSIIGLIKFEVYKKERARNS